MCCLVDVVWWRAAADEPVNWPEAELVPGLWHQVAGREVFNALTTKRHLHGRVGALPEVFQPGEPGPHLHGHETP